MKKVRIEVIDIAKAVTIFLVILGHTTGNFDTPLFRRVFHTFHMPLFFILAGMSVKPMKFQASGRGVHFQEEYTCADCSIYHLDTDLRAE